MEPKKAVVCIVARPGGEVLLGRRSETMRFMPGHHVFPGGRIDPDEGFAHVIGASDEVHAEALHATVREVFEETGLLCVAGDCPDEGVVRRARAELLNDAGVFDAFLERHSLHIRADEFEPAGVWLTPEKSPIRFYTRYFYHRHARAQEPTLIKGEFLSLNWFLPKEARQRWRGGDIVLSSPVSSVLHHLAAVAHPEVLSLLRRPTDRRPGVPGRVEIGCGITIVELKSRTIPPAVDTNCVIVGERELLVIDPGAEAASELEHLKMQLDHMVALGGRVRAVVLTHSHQDHVDGAEFVRETYGAPIWCHEATAEQVKFSVDRHIADNEVLEVAGDPNWRLRSIFTPGHDPGHLCFLEETTRTLICGDMMANPGTIVVSKDFGGDMNDFMESLERLLSIDCELLLPGHGAPMSDSKESIQKHIDHRLWREAKIRDALDMGCATIADLLAKSYDDVPKQALALAEHALKAHLDRLGVHLDG